jgi:outer membrane protein TolC
MMLALLFTLPALAKPSPAADFFADLDLFKQRSLVIRSDRGDADAARAASLSRLLQITPKISAGVGREWSTVTGVPNPPVVSPYDTRDWYWRASADWNLFRSGGDLLAWRAAKNNEHSQELGVVSAESKTEVDGAAVVFRRLFLRDGEGAQEELLKLKQETLRIGRDRYKQGKIPLQDVVKMEVDLSQQQNVVRQSEIDVAENEANYRSFFVDELKTRDWPFDASKDLPQSAGDDKSFEQRRLRERADSLDLSWKSSITKHAPSLDLSLSFKQYPLESASPDKQWGATLELSIPIWSRWELRAASAAAYATALRADDEANQNARDEELRREFLKKKVLLARQNLLEARANLDRADRLYRDMVRSFQLGRLSTNDLFLEQDRKIRTILGYTQARLDFHTSLMEACALRGMSAAECLR